MFSATNGQFAPAQPVTNAQYASFPPALYQGPPHPPQITNSQRFEANRHQIATGAPLALPFPPIFDELKHYAASQGFALPPPPPMPHPNVFPAFAGSPIPGLTKQPPFPMYQQLQQFPSQPGTPTPTSLVQSRSATNPVDRNGVQQYGSGFTPQERTGLVQSTIPGLDGSIMSSERQIRSGDTLITKNSHMNQSDTGSPAPPAIAINTHDERKETREKAKKAVADMISAGISAQRIIQEGIDDSILGTLLSELGLESSDLSGKANGMLPEPQKLQQSVPEKESRQTTNTPQPPLDPNMDRKDRIAQLLAARKGQTALSRKSSQSASPAPLEVSIPAVKMATPVTVSPSRTKTRSPERSEEPTKSLPIPAPTELSVKALAALPTPVREEIVEQGFSIPGLFMTAAEQDAASHIAPPQSEEALSKKRGSESLAQPAMPESKRQMIDPVKDSSLPAPVEVSMALDSPATPVENPLEQLSSPPRGKIRQDRLKDRMAALKADLLLKSQRQKALQDGMPVLDAEVERTRDRLTEFRDRLAAARAEVQQKQSELDQARTEEDRLLKDVSRLEKQLIEGETGQQQFSTELNQLNDQIVAGQETPDIVELPHARDEANQPQISQASPSVPIPSAHPLPVQDEVFTGQEQNELDDQLNAGIIQATEAVEPSTTSGSSHPSLTFPEAVSSPEEGMILDSEDDHMSIDEVSQPESDGSASMSDSGSEDYEPAIAVKHTPGGPVVDGEEYEAADIDYEPAEPSQANLAAVSTNGQQSGASSSYEPGKGTTELVMPTRKPDITTTQPTANHSSPPTADSFPPMTELPGFPDLTNIAPLDHSSSSSTRFMPYQSPLTSLRSFRFNSRFNDTVKDGYRSLTYSNSIDAKEPLCQTELDGQTCIDQSCDSQHFRSMALSDDKILVQMSSANDIKDKEQRDQYLLGLKQVIADLRAQGVKDFSDVAQALSKYRREWMATQDGIVL